VSEPWASGSKCYEGESANRSQMDIKRKTCDIHTWKKTFISWHILCQHWYTCPIALLVCRNPQHRIFRLLSQPLLHLCFNLFVVSGTFAPRWNSFTQQTLPTVNRKHFFMNILCIGPFAHRKMHNRMLLFSSTHSSMVAILTPETSLLNMRMCVCYLDCHEGGLCCYLVICIENVLCPLQMFYFHLWPIYWLFLVCYNVLKLWYFNLWPVFWNAVISLRYDCIHIFIHEQPIM
jgi:hypothetical protein